MSDVARNAAPALMDALPPAALDQVASYFRALSEPTRLQILNLLRQQERKVGDIAELCASTAANVSRHLSVLQQHGLVLRESRGTSVYYRIADTAVYELCDLVCGQIARQSARLLDERAAFFINQPTKRKPR